MSDMAWENPPDPLRHEGSGKWGPVVEALMGRPGEWAKIQNDQIHTSGSTNFLRSKAVTEKGGSATFEATVRKKPDGTYAVYARYIGESP